MVLSVLMDQALRVAPNPSDNSVPKQQGNNNSFANQTGAGYKGGQPFDNVPDGLPF